MDPLKIQAAPSQTQASGIGPARTAAQLKLLKLALEAEKKAAEQVVESLSHLGQNLDIRA